MRRSGYTLFNRGTPARPGDKVYTASGESAQLVYAQSPTRRNAGSVLVRHGVLDFTYPPAHWGCEWRLDPR